MKHYYLKWQRSFATPRRRRRRKQLVFISIRSAWYIANKLQNFQSQLHFLESGDAYRATFSRSLSLKIAPATTNSTGPVKIWIVPFRVSHSNVVSFVCPGWHYTPDLPGEVNLRCWYWTFTTILVEVHNRTLCIWLSSSNFVMYRPSLDVSKPTFTSL